MCLAVLCNVLLFVFHYFYFLIDRYLHISIIFKENVLLVLYICDLGAYHLLKAHRLCVWTSNWPSPRAPGSFTRSEERMRWLSRSWAAVSRPYPGAGGRRPGTCLVGFLSPWLGLSWELRVWQMGPVSHDNAASMV